VHGILKNKTNSLNQKEDADFLSASQTFCEQYLPAPPLPSSPPPPPPPLILNNNDSRTNAVNIVKKRYNSLRPHGQANNYFSLHLDKYQNSGGSRKEDTAAELNQFELNKNGYNPPFSVYRNKMDDSNINKLNKNISPVHIAKFNDNDEIVVETYGLNNSNNRSFEIPISVERTVRDEQSPPRAGVKTMIKTAAAATAAKAKSHAMLTENAYAFLLSSRDQMRRRDQPAPPPPPPKEALVRKVKYVTNTSNAAGNVILSPCSIPRSSGSIRVNDMVCLTTEAAITPSRSNNECNVGFGRAEPHHQAVIRRHVPCVPSVSSNHARGGCGDKKQVHLVKLELNTGLNRNDNCLKLLDDFLKEFD
jgi:hypothetical protein